METHKSPVRSSNLVNSKQLSFKSIVNQKIIGKQTFGMAEKRSRLGSNETYDNKVSSRPPSSLSMRLSPKKSSELNNNPEVSTYEKIMFEGLTPKTPPTNENLATSTGNRTVIFDLSKNTQLDSGDQEKIDLLENDIIQYCDSVSLCVE